MLHAVGARAALFLQVCTGVASERGRGREGVGSAAARVSWCCLSPQRWPTALPIALLCREWVHVRGGGSACVGSVVRPVSQREFIL
jgi:hypothetical protein